MTIYWAPFLHAYQPPWQDPEILTKIYHECYKPLLLMIERHPNAKFTLNVQGCLLDKFQSVHLLKTQKKLEKLYEQGKLEFVGSGKYHPIFPLIPANEATHQIQLQEQTLKNIIPIVSLKGFFPPEMATSNEFNSFVKEKGYSWVIMDGIANSGEWPYNYIQRSNDGIIRFFRDTYLSNLISFNKIDANGFIKHLKSTFGGGKKEDIYVITAQDAETFGHHIKYYETSFLGKIFSLIEDDPEIEVVHISDLLDKFPIREGPAIRASSWSTNIDDIASNVPYPLWQHPLNPVHKYQYRILQPLYQLMDLVEKIAPKNHGNHDFQTYYHTARYYYDQSLHSCWLWWASMRPMWSPNLIYRGLDLILKTGLNAQLALVQLKVGDGDVLYERLVFNTQKLFHEIMVQSLSGQHIKTYGKFPKNKF
ncbi:MAG: hypothetical protein ACTSVU_09360 [Promethearchaeota archaeon]